MTELEIKATPEFFPVAGKGHGDVSFSNPSPLCGKRHVDQCC